MPDKETDVWLYEYRGLKGTFRIPEDEQDSNGEIVSEIYYCEDGTTRSPRVDKAFAYADIIADRLDAERAKGGLLQAAQQATNAEPINQTQYTPPSAPAGVPAMGGTPTGYAAPQQADQVCPQCGGALGPVKQTSRGGVRECLQQLHPCQNNKGYPSSVWLAPAGGRR